MKAERAQIIAKGTAADVAAAGAVHGLYLLRVVRVCDGTLVEIVNAMGGRTGVLHARLASKRPRSMH